MAQKILCIYHANCADGFGAAWAVHRALGDGVGFVSAKYGESLVYTSNHNEENKEETGILVGKFRNFLSIKGKDILFVDFSAPLDDLRTMAKEARSVLVLDHHKTAQEDLDALEPFWHPYSDLIYNTRGSELLFANFDLDRSGAGLTWDYLHPNSPRPRIIDLIEDRDLWRFKFVDESKAFHAVLA